MDKMKFMMFTWPDNPEEYRISAHCVPEYAPGLFPQIKQFRNTMSLSVSFPSQWRVNSCPAWADPFTQHA